MTPNSDMPDKKTKTTTFNIINRAPQASKINQGSWRCVEVAVRHLHLSLHKTLVVVTLLKFKDDGFVAQEKRGGATVAIPVSYNKIVYDVDQENSATVRLMNAACVLQSNRTPEPPVILPWSECPEDIRMAFPEPLAARNATLAAQIHESLYGDSNRMQC